MIIGQVFGLLTSVIYARLLGPVNLGMLAIYTQLTSVAASVAAVGLGIPVARFVAQLYARAPNQVGNFVGTSLAISLVGSAAVSIFLFAFADVIGTGIYRSGELSTMYRIGAAVLFLNTIASVGIAVLQGLQEIRLLSVAGIFTEAITVPIMFVSLSAFGLLGAAIGGAALTIVSSALLFGSAWNHLRKRGIRIKFGFDRNVASDLGKFTLPLLGSIVIVKLSLLYQTSFLALSLGYDETGLFRAASAVSRIITLIPAAMSVSLLPALTELYATALPDRSRANLTTLLRLTVHIGLPLAVAIAIGANAILNALYGPDYAGASWLAFILVVVGFMDMINGVAANSLLGEGRTKSLLLVDIVQALVIVVATTGFVIWLGLTGVGFAGLAVGLVYGGLVLWSLARSGRIDSAQVARSLLLALGMFTLATVAVVWGGAQLNLWVGVSVLVAVSLMSWMLMNPAERILIRNVVRDLR